MSIYRKEYKLRNADVDFRRRLRWDTLFTMFQEASIAHTEQLGAGREKTLDRGFLWIITLQQVTVHRLPEYDELVTVESWPGRTMHVFFPRYYRLLSATGQLLAEGSALWALMDQSSRRLIFPEEEGIAIAGTVTGDETPLPKAVRSPGEALEPDQTACFPFTVPFSYLDLNGHMNNTRYFDLVQDLLPRQTLEQAPAKICVEYSGEAHWDDAITVTRVRTDTGWFFQGETDRRIFRMQLTY